MTAPLSFRKNGFDYQLVQQNDKVAIYSQNKFGRTFGWEVHKVRFLAERIAKFGNLVKVLTYKYRVPSNEDFGTYAWSFATLEKAQAKAMEVAL